MKNEQKHRKIAVYAGLVGLLDATEMKANRHRKGNVEKQENRGKTVVK